MPKNGSDRRLRPRHAILIVSAGAGATVACAAPAAADALYATNDGVLGESVPINTRVATGETPGDARRSAT